LTIKTPFELLHEHNPDFSNLKVFGFLSYASTNFPRQKFDVRAKRGVFLGYQTGTKGYLILDLKNNDIFVSRNVLFNESVFPFTKINYPHKSINPQFVTSSLSQPHFFDHTYFDSINQNSHPNNTQSIPLSPTSSRDYPTSTPSSLSSFQSSHSPAQTNFWSSPPTSPLRRSNHSHTRPSYLADYECYASPSDNILASTSSHQSSSKVSYPICDSLASFIFLFSFSHECVL